MRTTGLALGVFAAVVMLSGVSFGQTTPGFALDRFDPSERGSDWFSTDSLDLRGSNRFGVGVVGDWAYKPLVWYFDGDEDEVAVEHQLYLHLGVSWVLANRLRLAVNVPLVPLNKGSMLADNGTEGFSMGDVRVGADVRLFGQYRDAITAAFGVQVHIPSGNRDAFTSDGRARIVPRFQVAGDLGVLAYSARLGVNIRLLDKFTVDQEDKPFGTEVLFGAALGPRLADGKLLIGPEVFGSTVVTDGGKGFFGKTSTPFEVILGGHYQFAGGWRFGAGVGPGLTRGHGAPQLRVLASLEWYGEVDEEAPRSDRDGDGIYDEDDACPDEAGVASEDPTKHGCPLSDQDGDGIPDDEDACPDEAGVANSDPLKHGCPLPKDRDGDGIIDDEDACPDEAGVANSDPQKHGCPPPKDKDGDGIIDDEDACPDDFGPPNSDPKKHGCPRVVVTATEIKIMERVEFDTNRATIRPESYPVLDGVLNTLRDNPDIRRVSVEGHTDSRGVKNLNKTLSENRAKAVVKWLTDRGIAPERLTSVGFGQEKPVDTNDTELGRQNNRRVEFHIHERASRR